MDDIYGVSISAGRISQITDKVLPQVQAWRSRELRHFYPVVYLDAVHRRATPFKVCQDGKYSNSAFYTVYAVDWEGNRDILGLYINSGGEGTKNWGMVLQDLKSRSVEDILVICTDNLKGFSEQIQDVFPYSVVQKCIVHQLRNSLKYVDEVDKKPVAKDLRKVYTAPTQEAASTALAAFGAEWGKSTNMSLTSGAKTGLS